MDLQRQTALCQEARFLHQAFFGDPGPQELWDRYAKAHEHFGVRETPDQLRLMETLMARRLDAEAVEFVLRLHDRANILTRKVEMIHYLAECTPQRFDDFFLSRDLGWRAWTALARALCRAAWCLALGRWLVRRHGLA